MLDKKIISQYKKCIQANQIGEAKELLLEHTTDDALIYKYFRGTNRDVSAIMKNELWMANAAMFNDPYECAFLKGVSQRKYSKEESKKALEEYIAQRDEDARSLRRQSSLFVMCFSELNKSIPMWGYYAGDHKGLCVGYRVKRLIKKYNCFPVIYSDRMPATRDDNHYMEQALTKSKQWSHEKEWRIVNHCPQNQGQSGFLFSFVEPSVILLGCRFEENESIIANDRKKIREIKESMPCHFAVISDYHIKSGVKLEILYRDRESFELCEKRVK